MADFDDDVSFRLPIAEVNEVLGCMQRSIAWQQQICSKIVLQARAQGKVQSREQMPQMDDNLPAPPPTPPPPRPVPFSRRARTDGSA